MVAEPTTTANKERRIAFEAARIMERAAASLRAGRAEWALRTIVNGAEDVRYKLQEARRAA